MPKRKNPLATLEQSSVCFGMAEIVHPKLLARIEAACTASGTPEWRFGEKAINDANLIPSLREGRELRRSTLRRVEAFLATVEAPEKAAS